MNNIKYMLLDKILYAYIEDSAYFIAEYEDDKWERGIPLPMISYSVREDVTKEQALEITKGKLVDDLFGEIAKEIRFNNREKTEKEVEIEFFDNLVSCFERDYHLLKQEKPDFKYYAKEIDEVYGGNLYEELNRYYESYLALKDILFPTLVITKTNEDYIIEFE
jgi:hypothetical protein